MLHYIPAGVIIQVWEEARLKLANKEFNGRFFQTEILPISQNQFSIFISIQNIEIKILTKLKFLSESTPKCYRNTWKSWKRVRSWSRTL